MAGTKPSQNEAEYFARVEVEKRRRLAKEIQEKQTEEERKKLKELHYMHCSKCGNELNTLVFKGVMIDKCYHCGVVVLDDGELDKLVGEEESLISSVIGIFK